MRATSSKLIYVFQLRAVSCELNIVCMRLRYLVQSLDRFVLYRQSPRIPRLKVSSQAHKVVSMTGNGESVKGGPETNVTSAQNQIENNGASTDTTSATHPFTAYLQIVSFTATITISVSISASQGFATAGLLFGIPVDGTSATGTSQPNAIRQTAEAAKWLSWSATVSSLSLIITLVLQLLLTDDLVIQRMMEKQTTSFNVVRPAIATGSWIALALQGAALAFIGQALKAINNASGLVIQVLQMRLQKPLYDHTDNQSSAA